MKPRFYIVNGIWYASGILPACFEVDPFVGWVGDDMVRVMGEAKKLYDKFMRPYLEKEELKRQSQIFELIGRYDVRFGERIQ